MSDQMHSGSAHDSMEGRGASHAAVGELVSHSWAARLGARLMPSSALRSGGCRSAISAIGDGAPPRSLSVPSGSARMMSSK